VLGKLLLLELISYLIIPDVEPPLGIWMDHCAARPDVSQIKQTPVRCLLDLNSTDCESLCRTLLNDKINLSSYSL